MAHTVKIQYGNESPVDISTGDYSIAEYSPTASGKDKMVVIVNASSYSAFKADIQAINTKFTEAQNRRKLGRGPRVYVLWSPDGESDTYRSELYADKEEDRPGVMKIPESFMRKVLWDENVVKVTITVQRKPYWEDNAETELSLANHLGSGTGGRTIYNPSDQTKFVNGASDISFSATTDRITSGSSRFSSLSAGDIFTVYGSTDNDGTYTVSAATSTTIDVNEDLNTEGSGDTIYMSDIVNYVDIAGSSIEGDLPGRFRVEVEDTAGTGDPFGMYYGLAVINPDALAVILESEATVGYSTPGSASTNSSGYAATFTTASSSETNVLGWDLGTNRLINFDSGYYKLLVRLRDGSTNPSDIYIRPKFYNSTLLADVWVPEQQLRTSGGANAFIDLGTIKIPPWDVETLSPSEIRLLITGEESGGFTWNTDYALLMPAESMRYVEVGYGSSTGYTIVDDGIYEQSYQTDSSGNDIGASKAIGSWPELLPGRDHRIFFALASDIAEDPQADAQASVRIYYRARRSLI